MTGAGGTGKSKVVHALKREFKRLGLGRVLVTAYTGVAAAPFAGQTLLKLLNLGVRSKSAAQVMEGTALQREINCQKFNDECGAPIEEIGCIVIDEISFIDAGVFGHVDKNFATLLGSTNEDDFFCGGIPLLLCGDNHQKAPPGGTSWYQLMVKVASQEMADPFLLGISSAKNRGLGLLKSARRVDLIRLMRARDDPAFIEFQLQMRQADSLQPIPDAFLEQLHRISPLDLQKDAAWRFAPVGVLSHVERDYINLFQLRAFAKMFNLPIFRWRRDLVDDSSVLQKSVLDELYNHEPNLWSYFVEGAPVLLLETISSVRMLVNGSPGLLDSINTTNAADAALIEDGYNTGYSENMITLNTTPLAINVVVGGTEETPMMWHEVSLPYTSPSPIPNPGPSEIITQIPTLTLNPHHATTMM